jgi:iron(III) transport system substrate-binding protein
MTIFNRRRASLRTTGLAALAAWAAALAPPAQAQATVNIYSYREPALIEPLLKAFTARTGIATQIVFAPAGLIERMGAEGRNSPADVLLTNESSLLLQAKAAGVTQPIASELIGSAIPPALRDPEGHWVGLTRRARVVYASRARVGQDAISYEDLANPVWKGRICSRSGQHPYNVTLVAAMIAELGAERAEAWLRGVKGNLARKPAGGDREQVRDVFNGLCDLAIGNTYYMGAMETNAKAPEQQQWAASVKLLFPNAAGRGTHVNISGAALAANAPHKADAVKLIEFLASADAQRLYAEANHEYPVVAGVPASARVAGWGTLKADPRPLAQIAGHRKAASEMIDKVGFDAGP